MVLAKVYGEQGYINKTWGVPLTPKCQNDLLDQWTNDAGWSLSSLSELYDLKKFNYQLAVQL